MLIITVKTYESHSFVMSFHAYKNLWTPVEGEEVTTIMGPGNIKKNFTAAVMKKEILVCHLPKIETRRFTKTISTFYDLVTATTVM